MLEKQHLANPVRLQFLPGSFPLVISVGRRMTITNFSIEYDAINSRNTFTNGDIINGRIIVEVSKETTIQALIFSGQGEARVRWSEHYGEYHHRVYWQNEKYYQIKEYILRESRQDGLY